eukprot:jgi/Galph1/3595/GphlegSOOS_G2299.1
METRPQDNVHSSSSGFEEGDHFRQSESKLTFGDLSLSPITPSVKPSPAKLISTEENFSHESDVNLPSPNRWLMRAESSVAEDISVNEYTDFDAVLTPKYNVRRESFSSINNVTPIHQMRFGSPFSKRSRFQGFSCFSASGKSSRLESSHLTLGHQVFEDEESYFCQESIADFLSAVQQNNAETLNSNEDMKFRNDEIKIQGSNITLRWKRKEAKFTTNEAHNDPYSSEDICNDLDFTQGSEVTFGSLELQGSLSPFSPQEGRDSEEIREEEGSKPIYQTAKRKPLITLDGNQNSTSSSPCNCKRSQCLKLYCECFASGSYCTSECKCKGCRNISEYRGEVNTARTRTLERNPHAFSPKISEAATAITEEGQVMKIAAHHKGCNCKRSNCRKNAFRPIYRECRLCGGCSCVLVHNSSRYLATRRYGYRLECVGWAALALFTGVIVPKNIPTIFFIIWDATLTFVSLIVISLLLDECGFFHWTAIILAKAARGKIALLFPLLIILGALVSAFFANDGTALILTPIVLKMLNSLDLDLTGRRAFIMSVGFIADTSSLPLMISNLVNIVSASYFSLSFGAYAKVMIFVDIVSVIASLLTLSVYFFSDLPKSYDTSILLSPPTVIQDKVVFYLVFPVLVVLLVADFVTTLYGVPVGSITAFGALVLLLAALRIHNKFRGRIIPVFKVLKSAPWHVVLFSIGMYLVVYGLRNAGVTYQISRFLTILASHGVIIASLGTGFLSAVVSTIMNNLPSVLIVAISIKQTKQSGNHSLSYDGMVYANVVGCDLGPKFTPIGSLATLLWLHVLAQNDL